MMVSVVMASCNPDYNLLRCSIQSILKQSFQEFELIIVDDGSEKPLDSVIKSIKEDERIHVYRIDNSGLGAALNYGVKKSQGKYIARIDDDDMMQEDRLLRQVEFMENRPDVSCAGTWHYDKSGNNYYPHRKFPILHEDIIKSILQLRVALAHTTLMFRRSCFDKIGGYRILRGGQDLDLELQLGTVGKLANVPAYLNYYTMSTNGLSTDFRQRRQAYLFALKDVAERKRYNRYKDITLASIKKLECTERSILQSIRERIFRLMLIWRVKILGKEITANP